MKLAVFDLDHTLLPIDSGDAWSHWLAERAGLNTAAMQAAIEGYAAAYRAGSFEPLDFIRFQFGLLASQKRRDLERWREDFIREIVRPAVRPEALALLNDRRREGFEIVLATGTHRFVTEPIAALFGIRHLCAATPEIDPSGEFTGRLVGIDSYGTGKVKLVEEWIAAHCEHGEVSFLEAWSDSINDRPLLEFAAGFRPRGRAVAANPDPQLAQLALERGWETASVF